MPTPSKPVSVLRFEKSSHRTEEELKYREEQEQSTLTGKKMQAFPQVKEDPVAKKEFYRMRNLLKKIDKDDALYQGPVNRLAMLHSECASFEKRIEQMSVDMEMLLEQFRNKEIDFLTYLNSAGNIRKSIVAYDRQITTKRNQMLAIEKESLMTLAAALRAIPKKPPEKPKDDNADMFD